MLADFFTKPLQGSLFRIFRDIILGTNRIISIDSIPDLLVEERVGKDLQGGRGTDVKKTIVDADGFVLVKGKKKHMGNYVERNVVTARGSDGTEESKDKIVSWSLP
jgi:hypothetical protein